HDPALRIGAECWQDQAALADEGDDLLEHETVAGPHRGPRLPAARRSTFETNGVFWDRPEGRLFVARALAGGYVVCLVPESSWMLCIAGGVAPPQHPACHSSEGVLFQAR